MIDGLNNAQVDVLELIAKRTKMDCWFGIEYDEQDEEYYIVDNERNGAIIDLVQGVDELMQGLDCIENFDSCELEKDEVETLQDLLNGLDLPPISEYVGCKI